MRFSLGGGGTDIPAYYEQFGGYLIAAAIDKYIYVSANKRFYDDIRLSYSKTENVPSVDKIEHRIFREAFKMTGVTGGIEMTSVADVPANSGLGSSSTFTVALLNALHTYKRRFCTSEELAEQACHLEIERLKEPIGKQDQYIAACGGVTAFTFEKDGKVHVEPVPVASEVLDDLQHNLCIIYSGVERAASVVLSEQGQRVRSLDQGTVDRMHRIKELGHEVHRILTSGKIDAYGELLHEHWTNKRKLAANMTDSVIDEHYEAARAAGAIGGKLMGAGGGGFFMFYVRAAERRRVHEVLAARGLRPMRFRFDFDGARIMANFHRS